MKRIISLILVLLFALSYLPVLATEAQETQVTIMNCDTGRMITDSNGNQIFSMTSSADGTVFQDESGNYLDLRNTAPQLTSTPMVYSVSTVYLQRSQIQLPNGNYVYDSDEGIDNNATIANTTDGSGINTGWFITPTDEQAPLRVLTIGDSLTYGVDLDLPGTAPRVAYRQTLSENLIDYFGKVAFVGNVDEYTTQISTPYLYRHSGYSGYVIEDVYHVDKHPGVKPMVDEMMTKYKPDIVIMMLGTNDLGLASMVNEIIPRWESFVLQVEAQLPENGLLLCSAIPPIESSLKETIFNEKIQAKVHALANEGYKLGFADPYTPLSQNTDSYLNSDGVHYNALGYSVIGRVFTEAITTAYSESGEKVQPNPLIPADPYAEPEEQNSQSQPEEDTPVTISPIVWVFIGIAVAIVAAVIILILALRKKK